MRRLLHDRVISRVQIFADLHDFLKSIGKVEAHVDFNNKEPEPPADAAPISVAGVIQAALPSPIKRKMAVKQVRRFSAQIGHSLEFKLV